MGYKHGMKGTRIYNIWKLMKRRCKNTNDKYYKDYGGRGIVICDEWDNDFMNFYNWAIANGYSDKLTIERIDVNGNYEPANCKWISRKEQSRNRRNNVMVTYRGETRLLKEWCELLNLNYDTVFHRIKKQHLEPKEALEKHNLRWNNGDVIKGVA